MVIRSVFSCCELPAKPLVKRGVVECSLARFIFKDQARRVRRVVEEMQCVKHRAVRMVNGPVQARRGGGVGRMGRIGRMEVGERRAGRILRIWAGWMMQPLSGLGSFPDC